MKILKYLVFLITFSISSQESVSAIFIENLSSPNQTPISVDTFKALYLTEHNVLLKKTKDKTISYNNLKLGDIWSIDTFNPLKINIFYGDFNTALVLDNRLAVMFLIDFNTKQPYRNISFVSTGHDNTLWVFNQDTQQLELYDYKLNSSRVKTLPIDATVLDIKSNYNKCYVLTNKHLMVYNYFGSLVSKIKNEGYTSLSENNENIVLKKENTLFYLKKNTRNAIPISIPNLLIHRFFVVDETLYIYDKETLHEYQLKID
jgi:hypothetical protein